MGRDSMSVVDASLKVYGIEKLRIADHQSLSYFGGSSEYFSQ
jgi:choline dehydrogenase-like flavoprotein